MNMFEKIAECVVISSENIATLLATPTQEGKRELEPLKSFAKENGVPINVLEDTNIENEIEVHTNMGDLWYCLEGEATFLLGGELVDPKIKLNKDGTENPNEIRAQTVTGGEEKTLKVGDWLWIPPGVPHTHSAKGTARLAIIKIPKN